MSDKQEPVRNNDEVTFQQTRRSDFTLERERERGGGERRSRASIASEKDNYTTAADDSK